jgi:TolB-like protein
MQGFYWMRFAALVVIALHTTQVSSAESLDAAVEGIAQSFAESRVTEAEPMRVAVTAFVQSDRKTTQFTNLLMIALTGKMVQVSEGKFRVIERAQLETALAEIQLSDVPIFDRDTAQELGKFLGVDALVVGEITPLADSVRLDARMIDVETIETVEQAYQWVPLTPTVQRQLDTLAVVSRPRVGNGDGPDPRNGIWEGTGNCGDTTIGLAVSLIATGDDKLSAMQVYYPISESSDRSPVQVGVVSMAGTFDPATNGFKLLPGDWLFRPRGHAALGFSGTLDTDSGVISAKYDRESCGEVTLRRKN